MLNHSCRTLYFYQDLFVLNVQCCVQRSQLQSCFCVERSQITLLVFSLNRAPASLYFVAVPIGRRTSIQKKLGLQHLKAGDIGGEASGGKV